MSVTLKDVQIKFMESKNINMDAQSLFTSSDWERDCWSPKLASCPRLPNLCNRWFQRSDISNSSKWGKIVVPQKGKSKHQSLLQANHWRTTLGNVLKQRWRNTMSKRMLSGSVWGEQLHILSGWSSSYSRGIVIARVRSRCNIPSSSIKPPQSPLSSLMSTS